MPSNTVNEKDHTKINDEIVVDVTTDGGRPKSKKELRLERKAAKKKTAEQTKTAVAEEKATPTSTSASTTAAPLLDKEEYRRLKKLQKAELLKEKEILMRNKLKEDKKLRKRKMLNREKNAKGGAHKKKQKTASTSTSTAAGDTDAPKSKSSRDEQKASMDAFRSVLYGANSSDAPSKAGGMTTTRLGVQYKDKVVGTGKRAREGMPVTVRYELTGGRFGAVLDSSKKFTFQLGMGEVIQGWDIGLEGMRVGGLRKLVVPPKAGYGGKDIGAGPGALLNFEITLLSCGR